MKKMPTIFNRNYNPCRAYNMEHPDCAWVFRGEGVATRKWDGTCCMIKNGEYFKRRCIKLKKSGAIPVEFIREQLDSNTGKLFGWMPVTKEDKWHMEAYRGDLSNGTYELIGPKIQGNPENYDRHILVIHEYGQIYSDIVRTFDGIAAFMKDKDIEGIVFHRGNGQMAKIKKSDYGLERKP